VSRSTPSEVTVEDIDRVVGDLAVAGRAAATRREYVQMFKEFHRFLQVRKAAEIKAAFGVRLVCPVDEFNASRHAGDDSPALLPPPTPERVGEFFDFLKARIGCSGEHVLGSAEVSRVRLSQWGPVDLFAEDVAVTCVPGELLDHGEQCPSHADVSLAGIVLGVVEVEAGHDHT